jgi:hypothetical protein
MRSYAYAPIAVSQHLGLPLAQSAGSSRQVVNHLAPPLGLPGGKRVVQPIAHLVVGMIWLHRVPELLDAAFPIFGFAFPLGVGFLQCAGDGLDALAARAVARVSYEIDAAFEELVVRPRQLLGSLLSLLGFGHRTLILMRSAGHPLATARIHPPGCGWTALHPCFMPHVRQGLHRHSFFGPLIS